MLLIQYTYTHIYKYTEKLYYIEKLSLYKKLIINISPYKYIEKYIKHNALHTRKQFFKSFVMRECSHGFINPIPRIGDQRKD